MFIDFNFYLIIVVRKISISIWSNFGGSPRFRLVIFTGIDKIGLILIWSCGIQK